jgi:hypothetical protein
MSKQMKLSSDPDARVVSLEEQLAAAMAESEALRAARDVALQLAAWSGRRAHDEQMKQQAVSHQSGRRSNHVRGDSVAISPR